MSTQLSPSALQTLLAPLLASLSTSIVSSAPPPALLPLLSPILRQRIQTLSSNSEPWAPLLTYNNSSSSKLSPQIKSIAQKLEPHPVSGEIEVDWEDSEEVGLIHYKRIDAETLNAYVTLKELGLEINLVWCVGDELGGEDGWRIGEVRVIHEEGEGKGRKGSGSIEEAEKAWTCTSAGCLSAVHAAQMDALTGDGEMGDSEGEDDYWAQYDNTPGLTPAPKHSPLPTGLRNGVSVDGDADGEEQTGEDAYYAQYASVQPAMDNPDPDEAAAAGIQTNGIDTNLPGSNKEYTPDLTPPSQTWETIDAPPPFHSDSKDLAKPRPHSPARSNGSDTVAKLEEQVAAKEQCEMGVRRHIGSSVKNLYWLARGTGIERKEFEDLVRMELECLEMLEGED